MYLSLPFDRRLLNDLQAERFLRDVARQIEMEHVKTWFADYPKGLPHKKKLATPLCKPVYVA